MIDFIKLRGEKQPANLAAALAQFAIIKDTIDEKSLFLRTPRLPNTGHYVKIKE
jgi:hypothetical protein